MPENNQINDSYLYNTTNNLYQTDSTDTLSEMYTGNSLIDELTSSLFTTYAIDALDSYADQMNFEPPRQIQNLTNNISSSEDELQNNNYLQLISIEGIGSENAVPHQTSSQDEIISNSEGTDEPQSIKINHEYQYEDLDIWRILEMRHQELQLSDSIHFLATISSEETLANHLSYFKEKYAQQGEYKLLIPYNINTNHWVGIFIDVAENGTLRRAEWINSSRHNSSIPREVIDAIRKAYGSEKSIEIVHRWKQGDGTSCGPIMIENLFNAALDKPKDTPQPEIDIIRSNHIHLMNLYEAIRGTRGGISFARRQSYNLRSFSEPTSPEEPSSSKNKRKQGEDDSEDLLQIRKRKKLSQKKAMSRKALLEM